MAITGVPSLQRIQYRLTCLRVQSVKGLGVQGLEFRISSLGFRVWGLGLRHTRVRGYHCSIKIAGSQRRAYQLGLNKGLLGVLLESIHVPVRRLSECSLK